jgi:hypothetical protein
MAFASRLMNGHAGICIYVLTEANMMKSMFKVYYKLIVAEEDGSCCAERPVGERKANVGES